MHSKPVLGREEVARVLARPARRHSAKAGR